MPEGPEVKYLSLYLRSQLSSCDSTFEEIISNTKTVVTLPARLQITEVTSYGKVLTIRGIHVHTRYYVHIHLGLTGWITKSRPKIYKYVLVFDKKTFYISDRRRFSKIWITKEPLEQPVMEIFHPGFTKDVFYAVIGKKKKNICAALLDQTLFLGIGNYIKNDALFLAKISPFKKCNELSKDAIHLLHSCVVSIAYSSLFTHCNHRCMDLPPFMNASQLTVPYKFLVFDQNTQAGYNVVLVKHFGRNTYYVPELQF